jgi:membrane fusion protein (multidrug efflux system)
MKNLIVAGIVVLMMGCTNNHPVGLRENNATIKASNETVKIEKGQLNSEIKIPGQLKPFERVDVYPKVNGFIKEIYVDRGSEVHQGQVLMTLDAPEIEQQLQAATAKLLQAQEALNASRDRYLRLKMAAKKSGAISEVDMVSAESKFQADSAFFQSERANVNDVQAMKDYLVVKAPFDGVITERNVHPGTLTGPNFRLENKPLMVLYNNKKLRLEVFVPEEYVQKLDLSNRQISFTTDAIAGKTFTAPISRSSNALSDDYRSEAIEADVTNSDNTFKPGMYVEAQLKVRSALQSYIVPTSAVITSTEKKYVIAKEQGKAQFISVTVGITSNGNTEVYGVFTGDEVILKNPGKETKDGTAMK